MDYKEKYEQALERAETLIEKLESNHIKGFIYHIFPELIENKDEKIKKAIIAYISHGQHCGISNADMIAWLEKQKEPELKESMEESGDEKIRKEIYVYLDWLDGRKACAPKGKYTIRQMLDWFQKQGKQKKVSIWKHWKNGIAGHVDGKQIYLIKTGNTYSLSSCLGFECDYIELSELDNLMLEKQGKKKSIFNADDWYVSKVDGKIHNAKLYEKQGEKRPTYKIEPKFKVGDWVLNNVCLPMQIVSIKDDMYIFANGDAMSVLFIDGNFHLWTIQEAKDGNVLNSPSHRLIWIYKDNEYYHVCVNMNYVTKNVTTDGLIKIPSDACPATKEQRDLLFQKMKEAGYEWDAERKN